MHSLLSYYLTLPSSEIAAVLLSLIYVILAAKGNIWCWPAAFISTAIYTIIFYDVALLMDSFLSVYYMCMAIYGWYSWRHANKKIQSDFNSHNNDDLEISRWTWQKHSKIILLLALLSVVVGYFMSTYTFASFAYLDSATTVFAIFSTYLVAKKVLENWLYWIVIDFVSIYLYVEKSLQPTAWLFAAYVVIALYGYWKWLATYKQQNLRVLSPALSTH